jgi:hypothetical protein
VSESDILWVVRLIVRAIRDGRTLRAYSIARALARYTRNGG